MIREKIRSKRIFLSMFSKLILTFLIIGVVPLLLTGSMLYMRLAGSVEKIISANAMQIIQNFGVNIENMLERYDVICMYPYEYTTDKYIFLYEMLKDESISDAEKESELTEMLSTMLFTNSYIENVRFITGEKVYSVSRDVTKVLNRREVMQRQWNYEAADKRSYHVFPVCSDQQYYFNSKQQVFTIARNYMDAYTVAGAMNDVLGTIYLDVSPEQFGILEQEIHLGENSCINIYDRSEGSCIYSRDKQGIGAVNEEMLEAITFFEGDSGIYQTEDMTYSYYRVENTDWVAVAKIDQRDVVMAYIENSRYFAIVLSVISVLMAIMFYLFSQQITRPAKTLKNAMEQLEGGNLDTRVDICTADEMEVLGNGFNRMADNLQKYIDQVYLAEIRQRDAELDALKSTIKPHYLYNTLEVIRMSALTQKDMLVAEMLGSLSKQLQYLMGNHTDLVTLREEIQNIRDYFFIVQIRFENRFELEIDIDTECMDLYVLKLILQPIVENAVKHGLRPKQGEGKISISARIEGGYLQLTVMDDGIGMTDEQIKALQEKLEMPYEKWNEKSRSIGMKNVYDRIRMNYGEQYGFSVISMKDFGTIVRYRLPILRERVTGKLRERMKTNESDHCG